MSPKRILVAALAAASAVFIAVQVVTGWDRLSGEQLPGAVAIVAAVAVLAVGQLAFGEASVIVGADAATAAERRWVYHFTQPTKYVPAGIAHAAGSVAALTARGVTTTHAAVLWAVHTSAVIVSGIAIGLLLSPALGWPWFVVIAGVAAPFAIARRPLTALLEGAARLIPGLHTPVRVPAQRHLIACLTLTSLGVLLHGAGYAVLAGSTGSDGTPLAAIAAYGLALGISIATPLPGGLGAREAILLGLASGSAAALVPIVLVRLLLVGVELSVWLAASTWGRRLRPTDTAR